MPDELLDWTPRLGDAVWLEALKAEGTIIELDKDEAMVQIGSLKIRAALRDLKKPTRAERKVNKRRRVTAYEPANELTHPQRAVAGAGTRSARRRASRKRWNGWTTTSTRRICPASPSGAIIHGKGTGALRRAVQDRVHEHPLISKAMVAPPKEGGDGVTIIYMVPTA